MIYRLDFVIMFEIITHWNSFTYKIHHNCIMDVWYSLLLAENKIVQLILIVFRHHIIILFSLPRPFIYQYEE